VSWFELRAAIITQHDLNTPQKQKGQAAPPRRPPETARRAHRPASGHDIDKLAAKPHNPRNSGKWSMQ